MSLDLDLVAALEGRLVNAWPAFEIEVADGWLLRFAEGYSRRANAATAIVPGAKLDSRLVDAILGSFASRGVAPCFRLTGLEATDADAALEAAGLVSDDPSLGMAAALGQGLERDLACRLDPAAKPAWIAAAASAYGGDKANGDVLGRIVRRIRQPAAFATLVLDGHPAAWGLAVAERGYVGLYDIVVAPDLRGLGLGRRLVTTLMRWGQDEGASHAYLQMRETNTVADGLYRSLGFAVAYRYTQRVAPDDRRRLGALATAAPATMSAEASASAGVASA